MTVASIGEWLAIDLFLLVIVMNILLVAAIWESMRDRL